jgi:hypothetical protein
MSISIKFLELSDLINFFIIYSSKSQILYETYKNKQTNLNQKLFIFKHFFTLLSNLF